ncbi:MAG TPA: hypothetical protein VK674_00820 [Candidatus Limnocylindria bacterium]|nr:hypothetical protein [Candidatus Limnocylindria bacterium]
MTAGYTHHIPWNDIAPAEMVERADRLAQQTPPDILLKWRTETADNWEKLGVEPIRPAHAEGTISALGTLAKGLEGVKNREAPDAVEALSYDHGIRFLEGLLIQEVAMHRGHVGTDETAGGQDELAQRYQETSHDWDQLKNRMGHTGVLNWMRRGMESEVFSREELTSLYEPDVRTDARLLAKSFAVLATQASTVQRASEAKQDPARLEASFDGDPRAARLVKSAALSGLVNTINQVFPPDEVDGLLQQ